MTKLPLATRVRLERVLYTRDPISGTPYGVTLVKLPDGSESTMLACGKVHNLDHLQYLAGLDVNVWPTCNGLKLKPLDQQPDETIQEMITRLEAGPNPERVRAPELIEDEDPPEHPAANLDHPAVPVIGEMIAYVARVSMKEGIPAAGWAFIPVT